MTGNLMRDILNELKVAETNLNNKVLNEKDKKEDSQENLENASQEGLENSQENMDANTDTEKTATDEDIEKEISQEISEEVTDTSDVYTERNKCIALSAWLAKQLGFDTWIGIDKEQEKEWQNVVYIQLPTGQVSWHISETEMGLLNFLSKDESKSWDGHDSIEKYKRIESLIQGKGEETPSDKKEKEPKEDKKEKKEDKKKDKENDNAVDEEKQELQPKSEDKESTKEEEEKK